MKAVFAVLSAFAAAPVAAQDASANPLAKVIQLMDDLTAKVVKEGETADLAYREYKNWCDDAASNKRFEIKTLTASKGKLDANIGKLTSDIAVCDDNIDKLVKSIATATKELKDATEIREKEADEFAKDEAELMDTIDTLSRASAIISKEMKKNPAFAQVDTTNFKALMQALSAIVDASSFSAAGKQKLMALVQSRQSSEADSEEDQEPGAPAATVYKSHSADLLELLEDLKEKAEEDLAALRKAETNAKQNYEMLKQSLEDTLKNGETDKADEEDIKKKAEEEKANDEKEFGMTVKALGEAENVLANVKSDCMQVAEDHEISVAGRNEELKTIAQAKKVLEDTSTGAVEQSYSLVQVGRSRSRASLKNDEVVAKVKSLARAYHSAALAQLASRIQAVFRLSSSTSDDPFVKVKGLIKALIAQLEKEAAAAAEEKAYCDDQMAKTEEKKAELEEDLSKLTAAMDKAAASSEALKNEVKVLQEELANIANLQAEMDKIRADQKAAFDTAKAELTLGLAGVRKALDILKGYYGNNAESFALVQGDQPAKPVNFKKAEGAGGSIIGILQVVESDFAKNLAQEEQEESDNIEEYEKETQSNKVETTEKQQSVKYKVQEFKALDKAIADMTSEKETLDTQLKAVLEYYDKIKDRCIAKPEGYEERKRRREAEIAGLKEALSILEQDTAPMLVQAKAHRHLRRHF
jgi:chromosome segregation ATPase